jgi:hypothetical protein
VSEPLSAGTASAIEAQIHFEEPEVRSGIAWLDERQAIVLRLWVIANDELDYLEVFIDGQLVGRADRISRRPDVAEIYPGWENSGFMMYVPAEFFRAECPKVRAALHTKLGGVALGEVEIRYRQTPLVLPGLGTYLPSDALKWDEEIWRFAFILHLFGDDPASRLTELEDQFRLAGDSVQADRIDKVRAAREILVAAWCREEFDPMLTKRLQDLSYLSAP